MQQLEIQYFFPLTEQIALDLDFTPCEEYIKEQRRLALAHSMQGSVTSMMIANGFATGAVTSNCISYSLQFRPTEKSVGHWNVAENVQVHQENKPRWVVRKMSELLLGWKWKDK